MQNEWSWIHFRKFCNGIEWLLILMYFLCIGPIDITFDPPNYIFSILHWNFTSQNRWKIWPTMRSFIMFLMCSTQWVMSRFVESQFETFHFQDYCVLLRLLGVFRSSNFIFHVCFVWKRGGYRSNILLSLIRTNNICMYLCNHIFPHFHDNVVNLARAHVQDCTPLICDKNRLNIHFCVSALNVYSWITGELFIIFSKFFLQWVGMHKRSSHLHCQCSVGVLMDVT